MEGVLLGAALFLFLLLLVVTAVYLRERRKRFELLAQLRQLYRQRRSPQKTVDRSKLLARALSLIREGIVIMDPYGRIIFTNRFARELLDIDEDPVGKPFYQVIKNFDIVSLVNEAFNEKYRVWQEKKVKDHYVQIIFGSDMDEKVLLLIDLTPMKKYENLKKDFIANASHELKTPLAAMKLSLEALEEECGGNERALKYLKRAIDRVNFMEQLIEDFLTLSRLDSTNLTVNRQKVDLYPLLKEIVKSLSHVISQKGIKVVLSVPEGAQVLADEKMLYAVLKNLVDNAVKYNREGGKVEVSFREHRNEWEISVCDTGYGIPKSHLPFIFERFYRVERSRSRKSGGTGLGLSIVKSAVERMGGKVEVESREGVGTCFRVYLPKTSV